MWSAELSRKNGQFYLFMGLNAKPACLVCNEQVAALKENNIDGHYETHQKKSFTICGAVKKREDTPTIGCTEKTTVSIYCRRDIGDGAVKANFLQTS